MPNPTNCDNSRFKDTPTYIGDWNDKRPMTWRDWLIVVVCAVVCGLLSALLALLFMRWQP